MFLPTWLLTGSDGMWAADCLVPGCLWTASASGPEAVDAAALTHTVTVHPELVAPVDVPDGLGVER